MKTNELLNSLSSAYQEEAIENTAEMISEYEDAQRFADDCCDEYRSILNRAGFTGNKIYKAYRYYGDETELQSVALEYFEAVAR